MTERKYIGYSVEDLIHDQEFVAAVKSKNTSETWERFLIEHHESKNSLIQAREIIQLFQTSDIGVLDKKKKHKLWINIYSYKVESSENYRRINLQSFTRFAASILIILSLGGLLYLNFTRNENQYQFSESGNDLKTENSMLVLSNGNKVELKNSDSKITVLKGKNGIQINNDSIVENQAAIDKNTNQAKLNEIIIPFGKKSKLLLEDGTTVWLNAGSRFAFPPKFEGKKRQVILDGEAYFEVAKNTGKPFIITTGAINIEVLGTKFNVNAYSSDNLSETVLIEGSVNIWDNGKLFKDKILMVPSQKATYNKTGKEIVLEPELDPRKYIAWIDGWYKFNNESFELVLKKLEKYYNVKFQYDQTVKSQILPVTGKLDLKESLNDVLTVLSSVTKFEYQISGDIVIIKNIIKK